MFKMIMRYSAPERMLRLFRIVWCVGAVGLGGCSHKFSVGLQRSLFYFDREWDGWRGTFLGLHLSHRRSWGGIFASLVFAALFVSALFGAHPAFADTAATQDPTTTIAMAPVASLLWPYIQDIVGALIGVLVPLAFLEFKKLTGIAINAALQTDVLNAAQTAAGALIAKGQADVGSKTFTGVSPEIVAAVNAVQKLAPKAITATGMTPDHVTSIVLGEVGKLQATSGPPPVPGLTVAAAPAA